MRSFFFNSDQGARPPVERLTPEAFRTQKSADAVVIDVRTPQEYLQSHLAGAQNVDRMASDFRARVEKLDRDRPYYLYCRSGNRSGQAAAAMRDVGFARVYNIGGIGELAAAGVETE